MASLAQLSIDEYLRTSYRPAREYIDGELREKNVGKWERSRIQLWLAAWFFNHEQEWRILGATEWRTRVAQPASVFRTSFLSNEAGRRRCSRRRRCW